MLNSLCSVPIIASLLGARHRWNWGYKIPGPRKKQQLSAARRKLPQTPTPENYLLQFLPMYISSGGLVAQSCPTLENPWTVAQQAPLSMGFSRQEYWSGLPFPSPEYLPNPGIGPGSPALQADALLSELPGRPLGRGMKRGASTGSSRVCSAVRLQSCPDRVCDDGINE